MLIGVDETPYYIKVATIQRNEGTNGMYRNFSIIVAFATLSVVGEHTVNAQSPQPVAIPEYNDGENNSIVTLSNYKKTDEMEASSPTIQEIKCFLTNGMTRSAIEQFLGTDYEEKSVFITQSSYHHNPIDFNPLLHNEKNYELFISFNAKNLLEQYSIFYKTEFNTIEGYYAFADGTTRVETIKPTIQ